MEKLAILDYSTLEVHLYNTDPKVEVNEEYISDLGFHTSECSWMVGNIGVIFHKEILT